MQNPIRNLILFAGFLAIISACSSSKPTNKTTIREIRTTIRDTVFVEKVKEKDNKPYLAAELKNYEISDTYFPAAGQDIRQKFLILHYTALQNEASYRVLSQQQVSSHYLINDLNDNKIDILVSEDKRAWHAGVSYWNGRNNLNDSSIGIEIVNQGYTTVQGKMNFFPFPEYQIKKIGALSQNIVERYQIDPTNVLAHSDIAPQRKEDPGALFPWKLLYDEYGIGAWYEELDYYIFLGQYPYGKMDQRQNILAAQQEFAKYGYEIQATGSWDQQTRRVIQAFQLHFRPENYSGIMDTETWCILKALNKKYR